MKNLRFKNPYPSKENCGLDKHRYTNSPVIDHAVSLRRLESPSVFCLRADEPMRSLLAAGRPVVVWRRLASMDNISPNPPTRKLLPGDLTIPHAQAHFGRQVLCNRALNPMFTTPRSVKREKDRGLCVSVKEVNRFTLHDCAHKILAVNRSIAVFHQFVIR